MSSSPARPAAPAGPKGPRRRGASLTRAIHLATLTELAENGFDKLSFDKIASAAGTGKASLYRRWSTPAELVLAALTDPVCGFGDAAEPRTGTLRGDLTALLNGFARTLEHQPHGRALLPLITQRPRHPELYAEVRRLVIEPRQRWITALLREAAERGEADPGAVTPLVAAVGPRLVVAALLDHGTVGPVEVDAIVDEVLLPVLTARGR
ncbi:TetR/AcrR family transcriptional regulator [Streptantibioticus cattleyicolor]|uniref:Transcriptional regulator, TetR family n=1 Tax=Streptantibioticus cattleyicolor (strain ATCC 35852 / DSM 46488 / JCM 4925 / NBRC 14057 / NRRL 8057) TaxID=1003195 RepID=F8JKP3_STREN|nr:TetR/AcrR family transcriptional regulator [Streptantibioticus cattleyicolor]AEW98467.1 transcriptional regulator, TetR family [Streptantibioticus cattleyicolor NRRL 8057 = DSM 46488]CCB72477.1 Transcriptional regulator, tetR family [Streptantibioticus cattleyicolor NRRL 8057 = DSM 46488]